MTLPSIASAKDYCFGDVPGCTPSTYDDYQLGLALAEAESNGTADRFFLSPPAVFENGPYSYQSAEPIEIIGAGTGKTTLTSPPATGGTVLSLAGGPGSSVHDLTILLPPKAAGGSRALATSNTARRIELTEDPVQVNWREGALLQNGGTLEDSTVTLGDANTIAVRLGAGRGNVRNSTLSASQGVYSEFGGTVERSRLTVADGGVGATRNVTTVSDSLIRLTKELNVGVWAGTEATYHTTLNVEGVTIVGAGLPDTDGADVFNNLAPDASADLNLSNSIIRGVSTALRADVGAGSGKATLNVSYSDYDPGSNATSGGANAVIDESNVSNVGDAGFVDAAGGDYHLRAGSPLVDAGDPALAQGLDLDGNPLVADGNGDGTARRDMGAFELPPAADGGGAGQGGGPFADTLAPQISDLRAAPALFAVARAATPSATRVARGTRFRYTLSEPARVTIAIQRALPGRRAGGRCVAPSPRLRRAKRCIRYRSSGSLSRNAKAGANSTRFTGRIGRRALRPGRYRARVTATDAAGNRSAPRAVRLRVTRG